MYLVRFLADFVGFRRFSGNSRLRDRAKYQKPCLKQNTKFFNLKRKKIPRIMSVNDAKSSLKILVANAQLSVIGNRLVVISEL